MGIVSSSVLVTDELKANSFKTMPYEKNNNLFYGCELECVHRLFTRDNDLNENYYKVIRELPSLIREVEADIGEYAILKPDGHFEICTVPATLDFHKNVLWKKFFANSAARVIGDKGCGLHIHFSREALLDIQLAKVICFIMDKNNEAFNTAMAGRDVNEHVRWCRNKHIDIAEGSLGVHAQVTGTREAIHISRRNAGKSVEVRIFQSNPTEQGVFQALEYIDALINYTRSHATLEEVGYKDFLNWFVNTKQERSYPYLAANLYRLEYIKATKIFGQVRIKTLGVNLNMIA